LKFCIRESTWAFHRRGPVPQILDGPHFLLIGKAGKKTAHVKETLIPNWASGLKTVYKGEKACTCHIAITRASFVKVGMIIKRGRTPDQ
jgi:hypothetical protein